MADKVLIINNKTAMLTDALAANLRSEKIEILLTEPAVDKIGKVKNDADVFLLFAGDFIYESPEVLVYLKDLCFGEEKVLCIVGYSKEITEIEEVIPKSLIEKEFERPIDVKILSKDMHQIMREKRARTKKRHLLLVDDDVTFLQMMQKWLSARYRVTVVKSGMQAITFIGAHTPDLILLDYDMPITPGPQLLEMIRSEPNSAGIPVIFLTAKSDRESVMRVMRLKPEGYLLKSQGKEEIINSIDQFFF
ncbi:MAG: response regulator [Ruminococcaceae bacterium]|nr:response regulator [Oscillospiraceae bacterium]